VSGASHESCDLAIVGAGPAGLAAATLAAKLGMETVLLDEQPTPGGQIYRAIGETPLRDRRVLGEDYWRGESLVHAFGDSGATYLPGTLVWSITPALQLAISRHGRASLLQAHHIIVATGALERPFPIEGWTLPGVLTVGAAQIALKTAGLTPGKGAVLAGTGPLLWLLAAQCVEAGAPPAAILDTTPRANWRGALPHAPAFAVSGYAWKGVALLRQVKRNVRVFRGVTHLRAVGDDRVRQVVFRQYGRNEVSLDLDALFLHQGVSPHVNLAMASGCRHVWDDVQCSWRPTLDLWARASQDGLSIAGDGGGIAGALAAESSGRVAAIGAALRLGRLSERHADELAKPHRADFRRAARGRAFLDCLYRPARPFRIPSGKVVVCRCEEVTADQVRDAVATGCRGPNQLKAFLRCGMGPCQGRMCGLTVTELMAEATGQDAAEVGYYRLRAPIKPVSLMELSQLPHSAEERAALDR
jgi:NADPH-dependent 2,4-dienoyl-CoA reductase/sulfur reductase-like enzyme